MRIFRNKKAQVTAASFSWLAGDIHSHLLPGIDDGSPDVETALSFIRYLHERGLKRFICTPHVIGDMFRNDETSINNALNILQKRLEVELPDVVISAAAEYMLDDYFMQLLQSGKSLLTMGDGYLLTEFPYTVAPGNVNEMSFEIISAGYQPILAHPERYGYYHKNKRAFERLKELGFLFQMNLLSLTGYYGSRVKSTAKMLLKEGMVDFLGTDLHHENHLATLTSAKSHILFEKYFGDKVYNSEIIEGGS